MHATYNNHENSPRLIIRKYNMIDFSYRINSEISRAVQYLPTAYNRSV
jgi:hypothetical protein